MHIEIRVPKNSAPTKGIRLASGYMQRSSAKDGMVFYKPLTVHDGLSDLDGILNSEAIRNFIITSIPDGTIYFAIYNDNIDPFQNQVELKRSALPDTVFLADKSYRITP